MFKTLGGAAAVLGLLTAGVAAVHAVEPVETVESTVLRKAQLVESLSNSRSTDSAGLDEAREELAAELDRVHSSLSRDTLVKIKVHLPRCADTRAETDRGGNWIEVPVSSGGSASCIVRVGDTNSAVESIKMALASCHDRKPTSATFSAFQAIDRKALKAVQREARISADGIFGPQTSRYLLFSHPMGNGDNRSCGQRK